MFTRVLRSPDAVDGSAPLTAGGGADHAASTAATGEGARATEPAELPLGGENGMVTDLRIRHKAWLLGGTLSDRGVREMMADCCNFLRQLVLITSNVVESIGIGQVRKIVGPELAIACGIIGEDGVITDKPVPPEPDPSSASGRDHRKGPRGSRHPLTVLIQIAVQAAKLLHKITGDTNPTALNIEPLADRQQRMADREQRMADREQRIADRGQPYMEYGR